MPQQTTQFEVSFCEVSQKDKGNLFYALKQLNEELLALHTMKHCLFRCLWFAVI